MERSPDISVIIPTFNRATMVCDCVASVLAQEGVTLEVIVVDDCSPDDTKTRIEERFGGDSRVKYIRNEKNSFQAVSRNNGAKIANGKFLLFLDDDNILGENALVSLLDEFKKNSKLGLAAPMAVHKRPGKDNLIWSLGSDFNRWTSQPKDNCPNLPLEKLPLEPQTYSTSYYPNGFMVPREIYDEVGGFDESYVQIFEESDFGWKIREAGYDAIISTKARTEHLGFLEPGCVPELRQLGIEKPYRTYCFARNRLRFARRHFSFMQILSVTLVFAPLSAVYYCAVALKSRRADIAWAYLKGTLAGIFGL
ncbi:MAG: glycosyltransferase family 2 protein [Kiritimatiellae bacterium]|nr:glycosyltransferase family 2 protein [Kiritimatiellia bacterium]